MITVASFDVGVKNLAFCILQETSNVNMPFRILNWKCFDLTDTKGLDNKICENVNKKGLKCTKQAKIITTDRKVFCGMHNPDKKKYKLNAKVKVASWSYDRLGNALMDRLDAIDWSQVDHIIIEQQFSKNRKMIFLSAILFSYFMQTGQRNPESKIKQVKFASSRNKLQVYTDCKGPQITERPRKGAKDHRKWLAIRHCEWFIRNDEQSLTFFNTYARKKDDLSDCFLQGADYLKNDCRAAKRPKRKRGGGSAK